MQLVVAALRFSVDHRGLASVPLRRLINVPKGRQANPARFLTVGQPMRFHDLRHTHAALLITNIENPKVIQERLGHKDISRL